MSQVCIHSSRVVKHTNNRPGNVYEDRHDFNFLPLVIIIMLFRQKISRRQLLSRNVKNVKDFTQRQNASWLDRLYASITSIFRTHLARACAISDGK